MFQNVSFDAFHFQSYNKLIRWRVLAHIHSILNEKGNLSRKAWSLSLQIGRIIAVDLKKNSSTLIKVMVALSNLNVFKCLQDVHVNFMNPSVFGIQPSAKGKMSFPTETEAEIDLLIAPVL